MMWQRASCLAQYASALQKPRMASWVPGYAMWAHAQHNAASAGSSQKFATKKTPQYKNHNPKNQMHPFRDTRENRRMDSAGKQRPKPKGNMGNMGKGKKPQTTKTEKSDPLRHEKETKSEERALIDELSSAERAVLTASDAQYEKMWFKYCEVYFAMYNEYPDPNDFEQHMNMQSQSTQSGKKKKDARRHKEAVLEDEIAQQVHEAELMEEKARQQKRNKDAATPVKKKQLVIPSSVRADSLASMMRVPVHAVYDAATSAGMDLGEMGEDPSRMFSADDSMLIGLELGFEPVVNDQEAHDLYPAREPTGEEKETFPIKYPVTGVFGHVDHGKTSLLDALRETSVASGEAGGITQHIGAFMADLNVLRKNIGASQNTDGSSQSRVTFLDTPGHEAFTEMRRRGAQVTDLAVLVVAGDDGVRPQTLESIEILMRSSLQIVVAITKVDKPGVNVQRVMDQLSEAGLELEAYGGHVPVVKVSARTKEGLEELLETLAVLAEVTDIRAPSTGPVEASIIESRADKGLGQTCTVVLQRGTLREHQFLVSGLTWCKVRAIRGPSSERLKEVSPGEAAEIVGWKDPVHVGDTVLQAKDEDEAKAVVKNRRARHEREAAWDEYESVVLARKESAVASRHQEIEEMNDLVKKGMHLKRAHHIARSHAAQRAENIAHQDFVHQEQADVVNIIVKADVGGTLEAAESVLGDVGNSELRTRILASGVGAVSTRDVSLARTSNALIFGFNVSIMRDAEHHAELAPPVTIHTSPVIYRLIERVQQEVIERLPPIYETHVHAEATVLQVFPIRRAKRAVMHIAGCRVLSGILARARQVRVVRDGAEVFEGALSSLKHHKDDVNDVNKNVECGLACDGFDDFREGDLVQSIEKVSVPRFL